MGRVFPFGRRPKIGQAFAIGRVQVDYSDASAHPEDSHAGKLVEIPQRTLMSISID